MLRYTYLIDGLDSRRWTILHPTTYMADATFERQAVKIPGRHGEIPTSSTVASRALALQLLADPRGGDLDEVLDDLAAVLTRSSVLLTRVTPTSRRTAVAEIVGHSWDGGSVPGSHSPITVSLSLPGVWWRDEEPREQLLAAGVRALDVGSGPVSDAVLRFALQSRQPSLTDAATGTGISVAYAATSTQYVYVEVDTLRAWHSTSASAWTAPADGNAARLDHLVSYPGPGLLELTPKVTVSPTPENVPELERPLIRQATVTASHGVMVRYRRAWW